MKLRDICLIQSGGTPSRSNKEYWKDGDIPWVKISDFSGKFLKTTEEHITVQGLDCSSAKLFAKGTILYTIFATLGEVCILDIEAATNQAIAGISIIDDAVDRNYLYYFLASLKEQVNSIGRGVAQNNINLSILRDIEIPLPNRSTQEQFAYNLGRIDEIIVLCKQQLKEADQLVKSRFIEMFGDCRTNPMDWTTNQLGDIAEVGSSKRVFVEELKDTGIPFYRGTEVGALAEGKQITPELYITEQHYKELCNASGAPQRGDLLMPSICPDGRIWAVDTDEPFYFKDGRVLWVHEICNSYNPTFLLYTLKDRIMTDYSSIASGTTFAELKIFALKTCNVFDVPLALQEQFAAFVQATDKSKYHSSLSLEHCLLLAKHIQKRKMTCQTLNF